MEGEEQDRHSKALDAELLADPDERARVEARNGLEQFDAVIELVDYFSDLKRKFKSTLPVAASSSDCSQRAQLLRRKLPAIQDRDRRQ